MTNKYYTVPPEFLKGVFIIPHNFIDPENKAHATYVHNQSRYDLFYNAYEKIANIEARFLKQDNDYFRLKKIKSECSQDSFFEKFFTNYYINQNEDHLLKCEEWTLDFNNEKEINYKVKIYQSVNDRFFTLVFPYSFSKYIYLYWTSGGLL